VWAICEDGRKVLVSLSTTNSESYESCVEVLRGLVKRGMRTPVTTDGALGLTKAIDTMWPKALRIRSWFHKMQKPVLSSIRRLECTISSRAACGSSARALAVNNAAL
jgi:transposase-like protein